MSEVLVEITYDSAELFADDGTMGFRFTKGAPGEPPMVRGQDDTVAALAGRVPYPRVADVLPIQLEGWIHAPEGLSEAAGMAVVEGVRQSLLALFDSTLPPRTLGATLLDGSSAAISARAIPPVMVKEVVPGLRFEFDVALESVDPSWVITPA